MNAEMNRQTEQLLKAAREIRIPQNVQSMLEDGVARGRKAVDGLTEAAKDNAQVAEDVLLAVHAGAKTIGEKVMENTRTNTDAVFSATADIMRAKSIPEAARLQAEFMRSQFALAGSQAQELFQLYANVTKSTFEQVNSATSKAFERVRKVA